jgi:Cu(I)/Ag(I) efflux system membrane fusion protein
MKNQNIKTIIFVAIALVAGIGLGYVIFNNNNNSDHEGHEHTETEVDGETIYTCSMHPQIRQNEPGDCPICGMDLIPLGENTSSDPTVLEMTEAAVQLANIQTTILGQTGKPSKEFTLSGKIQADERTAASQVSHLPGRIEKLYVTFKGERVNKGQKVAEIYSPDLVAAQQELLEALKYQDVNASLLEAARKKLYYWKIPQNKISEIEQSGKIQEIFTIYAETSGVVSNQRVSVGDYVKRGEALFDLLNLNQLWVLFDAYEEDLSNISVGDRVSFTTPAVPNRTFTTQITFIDPSINPQTRTASLRGEIGNSGNKLKPEMFVTGKLQARVNTSAQLTVPKSAVMWTGTRSVVYVKIPNTEIPSFQFKVVEIGEGVGQNYLVKSGLEAGAEVVTNGAFTIDAAAQLNNQASMMNQNVKIKGAIETNEVPDFQANTSIEFKRQLNVLVREYLKLKDAFVETDNKKAVKMAAGFIKQLGKIDMQLVKGDAHIYWMQEQKAMKTHGQKIVDAKDVEAQRQQFQYLSDALINTLQAFGTEGKAFYQLHCPMVANNKGADWISSEKEIKNPYFGDKMMSCGIVKGELPLVIKAKTKKVKSAAGQGHQH